MGGVVDHPTGMLAQIYGGPFRQRQVDAEFIAACSPERILGLIAAAQQQQTQDREDKTANNQRREPEPKVESPMEYPTCRVCGKSLNGETGNLRVADQAWAHMGCVDEAGRDLPAPRDWEREYRELCGALLDATGAPDMDDAMAVIVDTFATMERVTGETHPEDALASLVELWTRVTASVHTIPIRDMAGGTSGGVRRWQLDARFFPGEPEPTLGAAMRPERAPVLASDRSRSSPDASAPTQPIAGRP